MIKKILCPTDFSGVSSNAIEFAAKLAQRTNSTLTLVHVQPVAIGEGINLFAGGDRESVAEAKLATKQLEDICLELNRTFKISCTHEIIASSLESFENVIAAESPKYDLTVIGTNGADTINQFYFGSHSYRVAKKETGCVIIVPENCSFSGIENLAFASDCTNPEQMGFRQLKVFTDLFNPELRVLYISEKDNPEAKSIYSTFCNLVGEALNYENNIVFERIIFENEAEAIGKFMEKTNAEILALYMEDRSLLFKTFHEDVIKKLTSYADFPILIFHE